MTATLAPPAPAAANPAAPARLRRHHGGVGNVAVAVLTLAAVVALGRLFAHPARFEWTVGAVAVVAHVVAWQSRRAQLSLGVAAGLLAAASVLCVAWSQFGSTTAYGLPWAGTLHAVRLALAQASDVYRSSAPPAPALPGFIVAGAFGAASAAFLADWAAFRMRATTEACLPSFSLFVLSCALAQGRHVTFAAAVWLAALLAFLLVRQAAVDGPATAWFTGRASGRSTPLLVTGAVIAAATVAGAALVGPMLPGATVRPVFDWRHHNHADTGRNTGSPLVDIKARLHDRGQQEVFTVTTDRPLYWRLTSLDTFEGTGWSLNDTYQRTGTNLAPATPGAGQLPQENPTPERATFKVSDLGSIWLPAAYRPAHITGVRGLSYSGDAASLITNRANSDGLDYTVDSEVPAPSVAALRSAAPVDPNDTTTSRYLKVPASTSRSVLAIALQQTRGAATAYDRALRLEQWFRSGAFRYSLDVPPDDSQDALVTFLTRTRAGFCQQFAGAYAVLARELGLPARVAVGFTPGQLGADGMWHVRDEHAHAWPEVYFTGVGWVAFEPTPGRGSPDPAAQAITGVPAAQQDQPAGAPAPAPTLAPTTTAAGGPATSAPPTPKGRDQLAAQAPHKRHGRPSRVGPVLAAVVAAPLVWLALLALLAAAVGGRRRARAGGVRARVALVWSETRELLTQHRAAPKASETPQEYARRAASRAGLAAEPARALAQLAELVQAASYGPADPPEQDATEATQVANLVAEALRADRTWWQRLVRLLDPRPLARSVSQLVDEGRSA